MKRKRDPSTAATRLDAPTRRGGVKEIGFAEALRCKISAVANNGYIPQRTNRVIGFNFRWQHVLSSSDFMKARAKTKSKRRWSGRVTRQSNALDLQPNVFKQDNPRRVALSLKRSAEASRRRKASPYQSAISMLNFYINRAGGNLSERRKGILMRAKKELREVFCRK